MFEIIWGAICVIWDLIKKYVVKIISWVRNILNWFKNPARLQALKEDRNLIAVAIKQNLDSGEYRAVNCLFDKSTNELHNAEEDACVIDGERLGRETEEMFGDQDMVHLS